MKLRKKGVTEYTEIPVKNYLRKGRDHIDSWFCSSYQASPYKGCAHNCAYCDGRSESYYYHEKFGNRVEIKINGPELFKKEILTVKEPGYLFIGSGITDPYQPIESRYHACRKTLQSLLETDPGFPIPVHILTKNARVEEDLPLISKIAQKHGAILSFSIAHTDENLRKWIEPGASPISDRFRVLAKARDLGINTGIMLMPVIPFISDIKESIESIILKGKEVRVDFFLFGGMTLKPGIQKDYYLKSLKDNFPEAMEKTVKTYANNNFWGNPKPEYFNGVDRIFSGLAIKHRIKIRIPQSLLTGRLPIYSESSLLLSHIADYLHLQGKPGYGLSKAGFKIQRWAHQVKKGQTRKKGFDYRTVEDLFRRAVLEGELKILPISGFANDLLTEFVKTGRVNLYERVSGYR